LTDEEDVAVFWSGIFLLDAVKFPRTADDEKRNCELLTDHFRSAHWQASESELTAIEAWQAKAT
jgi:hypothetical protein